MAVSTIPRAVKKEPVEKLQEEHLTGPANDPIEKVAEDLGIDQVVTGGTIDFEKVIFRNQRDPGHPLEFHYSSKASPFKIYKLMDGEQYTLHREVIKNLESCRELVHKYRRNAQGLPEIFVAGYKSHFVCERAA